MCCSYFHIVNCDFESTYIKAGAGEAKEVLRVEEATGEPRRGRVGSREAGSRVSPRGAAAAHCSPGCKSLGDR